MRGLVFSEFLDFVDRTTDTQTVERMIDACELASGGAYTSVGFYDHRELLRMIDFLNHATGVEVSCLVMAFGRDLFARISRSHPHVVRDGETFLDFLAGIETHIHAEVRKLYPEAELARFETERPSPERLVMHYRSARPFADLAHGMLLGAGDWFGVRMELTRSENAAGGYRARFDVVVS